MAPSAAHERVDGVIQTDHLPVTVRSSVHAEVAALESLRQCHTDLERYLYLRELRELNEPLYFKLLINNAQEILPYVYTPTVGEACQKYSHLPITTRGIFLTPADKGKVLERLKSWPQQHVRVVVVTDGERILGLGDLGYGGMGISEGKILLYTVIAGVDPTICLPVCIDVGTNTKSLVEDPGYKGLRHERVRGAPYDELLDEFMAALRSWQPHLLLQFEDFGNQNAFRLLEKFRPLQCCFNDDIQGTACITLAGFLSALRVTGRPIEEQRIIFLGAGEAGTGIGKLIARAVQDRCGLPEAEALRRCFYVDSHGLVCASRHDLQEHKLPFAHDVPFQPSLLDAVKALCPTMLVGVSTQTGAFTREVIELMAEINERPIIFPLSNPTSKAECTYKEAFEGTRGKVVFASGSPFPAIMKDGKGHYPAQANNAYIFGPIGMAALLTKCREITDDVFLKTAEFLADMTPEGDLEAGLLFPTFTDMKMLVVGLIAKVAAFMVEAGLGQQPPEFSSWEQTVRAAMFQPHDAPAAGKAIKVPTVPSHKVEHEEMEELTLLRELNSDLDRYLFLRRIQVEDKRAFWKLLINNAQEMLPYVYTPTVGEACQKYSHLPIATSGIFLTPADKGKILDRLKAWPHRDIRVIVITDGERILGLGDLGYGGMGISEGKILLYTVIAGVHPDQCLPVCLDVGTNTQALLDDSLYKGLKHARVRGAEYDAILDEFMAALREWQPHTLLQFEDFGNVNAFRLLDKFRPLQCCFNDDIQGTACIMLAGLLSALRVTKRQLAEQRILFLGAGEAGTGIGQLVARAMVSRCGMPMEEALRHCFYVDSHGLVCASRGDLQEHKLPFAHDVPFQPNLLSAIKELKPSMLVGVSTQAGAFTEEVLQEMARINERPIVFPLSNPTSKSECTFADAYRFTNRTVVFASGSPFPPFTAHHEETIYPAQANNAYIFGPIGMAAILTKCKSITDEVFLEAAESLAAKTPESRLASGMLFPAFSDMKAVAPELIADVARFMVGSGLGTEPEELGGDWVPYVKSKMYRP